MKHLWWNFFPKDSKKPLIIFAKLQHFYLLTSFKVDYKTIDVDIWWGPKYVPEPQSRHHGPVVLNWNRQWITELKQLHDVRNTVNANTAIAKLSKK